VRSGIAVMRCDMFICIIRPAVSVRGADFLLDTVSGIDELCAGIRDIKKLGKGIYCQQIMP
jgi:hypothetical protein